MRTVTMLLGAGVMIATTLMLLGTPQEVGMGDGQSRPLDQVR